MTALNAFTTKKSLDTFKKILLKKGLADSDIKNYYEDIEKVLLAFKHQIVFDPKSEKLVPLYEPENQTEMNKLLSPIACHYTGEVFDNYVKFCNGDLDFETLQPRTPSSRDFAKLIRFFEWKPQETLGFLRNLCKKPVTFDNFENYEEKERKRCIEGGTSSEGSGNEEPHPEENKLINDNMTVSTVISPYKRIKKGVSKDHQGVSRARTSARVL